MEPAIVDVKEQKRLNEAREAGILFYEYFHGDNGAGLGASHQTGWTGLVATLIQLFGSLDAKTLLEAGKTAAFVRGTPGGEVQK